MVVRLQAKRIDGTSVAAGTYPEKRGWFLRSDIIWQKDNPMPESAKDRPSRCYEHIFLLTKSGKYFYDNLAVAEPIALSTAIRYRYGRKENTKYADGIPGRCPDSRSTIPAGMEKQKSTL